MTTIPVFIPQSIDIERLLRLWPYEHIRNLRDKLCYVLGLPYFLSQYYGDNGLFIWNGFVPINIKKLREAGIREGDKILEYLVCMCVFETDGYFIPGEKSKYYRYYNYINNPIVPYSVNTKSLQSPASYLNRKRYDYLNKWFNSNLSIDYKSAIPYVLSTMNVEPEKKRNKAIRSGNKQLANIVNILLGEFRFHIDNTGYRLHTNLTNLRSDIRPFIRYNSKVLVSCDLKNSQLFLLLILLSENFYNKNNKISIYKYLKKEELEDIDINTIKMTISLWDTEFQNITLFTELCRTGNIYEYLMEIFSDSISEKYSDRNKTKKALLWALFDENCSYPKERELFEKAFPPVGEICSIIRSGHHELLPILLQRIESDIVLNKACKRISKLIPEVPIFTIHDSVIVTEGNESLVKNVLKEELYSVVGVKPTIKVETWT